MSSSIMNNPNFLAYTRLTLVSHVKKHLEQGKPMPSSQSSVDYKTFSELLEKEVPVNEENARNVSRFYQNMIDRNVARGDTVLQYQAREAIVKAFEWGLVDENGELITANDISSIDVKA